jgi:non-ribosomal peptide synthetase component F
MNVVAILSILKAGGQYVPLDGDTIPDTTLLHVLNDAKPVVVLSMRKYTGKVGEGWDVLGIEEAIKLDWMGGVDDSPLDELAGGKDGCYVIYTSGGFLIPLLQVEHPADWDTGTTGKPKGVDVTHSGVCNCTS